MLKPLNGFVVMTKDKQEETLPSGIVIPKQDREEYQKGTIFSVGPDSELKPGMTVFYDLYKMREITIQNVRYWVGLEKELVGILED